MPKLTPFALANDGRLVYRNTGSVVRGSVDYATNRNMIKSTGYTILNNRVYKNGRLAGYIAKGTKAQQERIKKRAIARLKRAEKQAFKQAIEEQTPSYDSSWDAYALAKDMMENYHTDINTYNVGGETVFMSREEQGLLNYASVLKQAVDSNILDDEQASKLWYQYKNGSESERNELWNEIHQKFDEQGYEIDSPPLFGEMGRNLATDQTTLNNLFYKL